MLNILTLSSHSKSWGYDIYHQLVAKGMVSEGWRNGKVTILQIHNFELELCKGPCSFFIWWIRIQLCNQRSSNGFTSCYLCKLNHLKNMTFFLDLRYLNVFKKVSINQFILTYWIVISNNEIQEEDSSTFNQHQPTQPTSQIPTKSK